MSDGLKSSTIKFSILGAFIIIILLFMVLNKQSLSNTTLKNNSFIFYYNLLNEIHKR